MTQTYNITFSEKCKELTINNKVLSILLLEYFYICVFFATIGFLYYINTEYIKSFFFGFTIFMFTTLGVITIRLKTDTKKQSFKTKEELMNFIDKTL